MKARIIFVCVFHLGMMSSCAFLGTRSSILNVPKEIPRSVAVIILKEEVFPGRADPQIDFLMNYTVARELASRHLFKFKILDVSYSPAMINQMERSLLGLELAGQYDAFLLCQGFHRGRNFRMELSLYQSDKSIQIIQASHSTAMGNSYMVYQPNSSLLVDATIGSMDALEAKWKKLIRERR